MPQLLVAAATLASSDPLSLLPLLLASSPLRGILGVLLGVGALIFFHELGHFMAAKWAGVRVDVFSLGMGPRLWGFQRGDTDYRISLLPIGGYVSMLGQVDGDPNQPASQDDGDFRNKSVFKRFVIMVAGVVMNVILAAALFVACYGIGHEVVAPEIGRIRAGSGASKADLRAGDIVLAVGGDQVTSFSDLAGLIAINGEEQVTLRVQRGTEVFETQATPVRDETDTYARLGVEPRDLWIRDVPEGSLFTAAGVKGSTATEWDRIVNVSPVDSRCAPDAEMSSSRINEALIESSGPMVFVFERARYDPSGFECLERSRFEATITLPRLPLVILGPEVPNQAWIRSVREGSAADQAGIKVGDRLVSLNGLAITRTNLEARVREVGASQEGRPVVAVLEREGERLELQATLEPQNPQVLTRALEGVSEPAERLEIRREAGSWLLGVTYADDVVASVSTMTPAADGAEAITLQPGDQITGYWADEGFLTWGKRIDSPSVGYMSRLFSNPELKQIKVAWLPKGETEERTAVVKPRTDPSKTFPDFGSQLVFGPRIAVIERSALGALALGLQRTGVETRRLISTLGAFLSGSVSHRELGGPIQIMSLTYRASQETLTQLLYLLAILSVNLAVINLLPIPVLDGGHIFFLMVEKLKGRPVSGKVLINAQWFGLFCILGLLALVFFNDIRREWFP